MRRFIAEASMKDDASDRHNLATFGGGCFWCIEAVLQRIEGVLGITSGYAGGTTPNPTYEEVCSGETGHAEVVQVAFDPALISYEEVLDIFWQAHDPTTLNRQGPDTGTQYRSVIFSANDAQHQAAEASKKKAQAKHRSPIVTEILPLETFWKAEDYHQNYYNTHQSQGYCRMVISPKLKKLKLE
jgi:peptide-methionine (S)-S-oxide reductase